MKINYSREAVADLLRLRAFIAKHDPAATSRYAQSLIEGVTLLEKQPMMGHPVACAPEPENIRDLLVDDYIVRYALLQQQILILRIWHHKENWK